PNTSPHPKTACQDHRAPPASFSARHLPPTRSSRRLPEHSQTTLEPATRRQVPSIREYHCWLAERHCSLAQQCSRSPLQIEPPSPFPPKCQSRRSHRVE